MGHTTIQELFALEKATPLNVIRAYMGCEFHQLGKHLMGIMMTLTLTKEKRKALIACLTQYEDLDRDDTWANDIDAMHQFGTHCIDVLESIGSMERTALAKDFVLKVEAYQHALTRTD